MRSPVLLSSQSVASPRRPKHYDGFFFDDFAPAAAWIKERAVARLPHLPQLRQVRVRGEFIAHPEVVGIEAVPPRLDIYVNGKRAGRVAPSTSGPWEVTADAPMGKSASGVTIEFVLRDVAVTNFLARLGRAGERFNWARRLQRFRRQNRNRQLRIRLIEADGEPAFDFSNRHGPYLAAFARKHARLGLNVVGFLTADLGVGESARCMIRAARAVDIPAAAVPLKLHCKARLGDQTYANELQETNPHRVNVFHLDPPASSEIDKRHGTSFRAGRFNVGYWAWELPEFPDAWLSCFEPFQEIWCPSDFVRSAIAPKSPVPVFTMPHAISFDRPTMGVTELRAKFGLPVDRFLFLFLYDLNSYSERKNPRAVVEAFRRSGLAGSGASLVIKVHGTAGNEKDLQALNAATADLPGTLVLARSFSRQEVYELEMACDCFVSLHRSEGFGFAPAECMYLGKPVIATDWSATSEFLDETNGAPVRCKLKELEHSHGPYSKGQVWADPDLDHAAEWMRRLVGDRALAERLGRAARETIETRFSPTAVGDHYRRRLDVIASWPSFPPVR